MGGVGGDGDGGDALSLDGIGFPVDWGVTSCRNGFRDPRLLVPVCCGVIADMAKLTRRPSS